MWFANVKVLFDAVHWTFNAFYTNGFILCAHKHTEYHFDNLDVFCHCFILRFRVSEMCGAMLKLYWVKCCSKVDGIGYCI